jgi:pre-mRNA-splicing helicase BRR2
MHGKSEPFHIFVLDCDCEKILYSEQFSLKHKRVVLSDSKSYSFSFTVPLFEIMHPIYFIKVVSDRWIQCESEQAIPFKNLILPEPFQRQTDLLGRTPLPLDAIQYPNIVTALKKKVLSPDTLHFDPVQTQVFSNIYESDDSVFVGCPSFQSKHILPYLAILASVKLH